MGAKLSFTMLGLIELACANVIGGCRRFRGLDGTKSTISVSSSKSDNSAGIPPLSFPWLLMALKQLAYHQEDLVEVPPLYSSPLAEISSA
jgi:hypothetical protein